MQATGSGYTSRSAALRARAEAVDTLRRAVRGPRGDTLADWLESWLARRSAGSNALRPATLAEYRHLSAVIRDAIGGERLRDVTADTLDDLKRHLHKTLPGKATTHARIFAVLQSAARDAYRRGMIADDPTRRRDTVRAPKTRRTMLQPEQFARLVDRMTDRGERMAPVFWVAAATSLRRGEFAGLRWIDVDLTAGRLVGVGLPERRRTRLHERRRLSAYPRAADAGPPPAIHRFNDELRIAQLSADEDAAELARLAHSHGMGARRLALIRADAHLTGKPLPAVTFHSLRHLHSSILLASGRGLQAVQRRLGHASITVSSDLYGHLVESAARADAEVATALIPSRPRSVETARSQDVS